MGLLSWWKSLGSSNGAEDSVSIGADQEIISNQVPELSGMDEIEGMAHAMQVIEEWKVNCTKERRVEFVRRGKESMNSWEADGLIMPYWGSLWILRTYQKELGLEVPNVAPQIES